MTPLEAATVAAIAWFLVFVVLHIGWVHFAATTRYSGAILASFGIAAVACSTTIALVGAFTWRDAVITGFAIGAALFLMACTFVLYTPFVFVIASSLSVDTLLLLDRAAGERTANALFQHFASPAAVQQRLQIMRGNRLVSSCSDGRYQLTPRGAKIAKSFAALKGLWNLWPGG